MAGANPRHRKLSRYRAGHGPSQRHPIHDLPSAGAAVASTETISGALTRPAQATVTNAGFAALHALPVSALLPSLDRARSATQSPRSSRVELSRFTRTCVRFRLWLGGAVALWLRFARRSAPPPLHFRPPPADRSGWYYSGPRPQGRTAPFHSAVSTSDNLSVSTGFPDSRPS